MTLAYLFRSSAAVVAWCALSVVVGFLLGAFCSAIGLEEGTTGQLDYGRSDAGLNLIRILTPTNAYPGANGYNPMINGTCIAQ